MGVDTALESSNTRLGNWTAILPDRTVLQLDEDVVAVLVLATTDLNDTTLHSHTSELKERNYSPQTRRVRPSVYIGIDESELGARVEG